MCVVSVCEYSQPDALRSRSLRGAILSALQPRVPVLLAGGLFAPARPHGEHRLVQLAPPRSRATRERRETVGFLDQRRLHHRDRGAPVREGAVLPVHAAARGQPRAHRLHVLVLAAAAGGRVRAGAAAPAILPAAEEKAPPLTPFGRANGICANCSGARTGSPRVPGCGRSRSSAARTLV